MFNVFLVLRENSGLWTGVMSTKSMSQDCNIDRQLKHWYLGLVLISGGRETGLEVHFSC